MAHTSTLCLERPRAGSADERREDRAGPEALLIQSHPPRFARFARGLERTPEAQQLIEWSQAREALITPTLTWFEFLCGPVTPIQIATMRAFLREVVALGEPQAIEAARLFNAVGRRRTLRVDSMIAGSAIVAGARLATNNRDPFKVFTAHGLQMI